MKAEMDAALRKEGGNARRWDGALAGTSHQQGAVLGFALAQPANRMLIAALLAVLLLLPSLGGIASTSTVELVVGAALILAFGFAGYRLGIGAKAAVCEEDAPLPATQAMREILLAAIPVWLHQLQAVRLESQRAIDALARSFEDIVAEIEQALAESRHVAAEMHGCGGFAAMVGGVESELNDLSFALAKLDDEKRSMLSEIRRYDLDLREINNEATQLALQSKMLSFNAAIEAARAGAPGRAFAVVVGEIRELSTRSGEASRVISDRLNQIESGIQLLSGGANTAGSAETDSVQRSRTVVANVTRQMTTLNESLERSVGIMELSAKRVRAQVADALVALQFQDRISQILGHMAADLEKLRRHLDADTLDRQVSARWLDEMRLAFSTDEEHASVGQRGGSDLKNVTFF